MTLELDHVFLMCAPGAPEAAALSALGLREGSANQHPGQGTACRRFFFARAYLELLWVSDAAEAQAEPVRPTRLWDRWSGRKTGACPFGIVLRPQAGVPDPPFETWSYRPPYLPHDAAIEIAGGTALGEPEILYIRDAARRDWSQREPTAHSIPLAEITHVTVAGPPVPPSKSTQALEASGLLTLRAAREPVLTLEFDGAGRGESVDLRPELPLILRW